MQSKQLKGKRSEQAKQTCNQSNQMACNQSNQKANHQSKQSKQTIKAIKGHAIIAFKLHPGRTPKQHSGIAFRENAKAKFWDCIPGECQSEFLGLHSGRTPKQSFWGSEWISKRSGEPVPQNRGTGSPVLGNRREWISLRRY